MLWLTYQEILWIKIVCRSSSKQNRSDLASKEALSTTSVLWLRYTVWGSGRYTCCHVFVFANQLATIKDETRMNKKRRFFNTILFVWKKQPVNLEEPRRMFLLTLITRKNHFQKHFDFFFRKTNQKDFYNFSMMAKKPHISWSLATRWAWNRSVQEQIQWKYVTTSSVQPRNRRQKSSFCFSWISARQQIF